MQKTGSLIPELLTMPLRDVARGLSGVAPLTEDALAPVYSALPKPLQTALRDTIDAIKSGGASVVSFGVDVGEIERASLFVSGAPSRSEDAAICAKVIAFAWDRLKPGQLASETVLAPYLATNPGKGATPFEHAAALLLGMAESNAFGRAPGLPLPDAGDVRADVALALVAPVIWLLADREETLEADVHLLELANALAGAFEDTIRSALSDRDHLAELLRTMANHL